MSAVRGYDNQSAAIREICTCVYLSRLSLLQHCIALCRVDYGSVLSKHSFLHGCCKMSAVSFIGDEHRSTIIIRRRPTFGNEYGHILLLNFNNRAYLPPPRKLCF